MTDETQDPGQRYQPEQTGMYELEFPGPQLTSPDGRGPVLVHALEGFSDAGHAIKLAAQHLKNTLDTELVAWLRGEETFDGLDALKTQIDADAAAARTVLSRS